MKVIEFSAWASPIIHTVSNSKAAKRLARRLKDDQKLSDIYTEREYAKKFPFGGPTTI